MQAEFDFYHIHVSNEKRMHEITVFLQDMDLTIDFDVEYFVVAYDYDKLIGCGGIAGNMLKSIAVLPDYRGGKLAPKLLTEIISFAYELERYDLFLYTRPYNKILFENCGFKLLIEIKDKIILMENSGARLQHYTENMSQHKVAGKRIGSIIMNANPFTLGHKYLAEFAAKDCDWLHLFVVKENLSFFPFKDRLKLIEQGLSHIKNITIHAGSDYIISRATFPSYFIKDQHIIDDCHTAVDLTLFKQYIAPCLGINVRYVGTEPFCPVTNAYNNKMLELLNSTADGFPAIEVVLVERSQYNQCAISASRVRELLQQHDFDAIKKLVPQSTYDYLTNNFTSEDEIILTKATQPKINNELYN